MSTSVKQLVGEFFASLFLGYLGLGVVVSMVVYKSVNGVMEFGIAFALVIAVVITIFNPISGAHFNPSVTFGFAVWGMFPKKMVIPYWIMQILGWGVGAALLYLTFGPDIVNFELANGIVRGTPESMASAGIFFCTTKNVWIGMFAEFCMTAFLLIVVSSCIDPNNPNRPTPALFPLIIGLTVGFLVAFGASLTGTALNPARDFGPRLFCWLMGWGEAAFPSVWYVYWIGPLLGGAAGVGFYTKFLAKLLPAANPS